MSQTVNPPTSTDRVRRRGRAPRLVEPVQLVRRRANRLSFRLKTLIGVCALVLLTGAGVALVAMRSQRESVTQLAGTLFREVSSHGVTQTRSHLLNAVPLIETLEHMAVDGLALDDSDRLARQLADILKTNSGITWISYGDESGSFTGAYHTPEGGIRVNQSHIVDGVTKLIEHNVAEDGSWQFHRRDNTSEYDPRTRPYYLRAKEARRLVWSPPYVFYDQSVPGITCANPLVDQQGKLLGVLTVDFDLNTLSKVLPNLSVSPHSKFFLFTTEEMLIAYPGQHVVVKQGGGSKGDLLMLADVADPVVAEYRKHLRPGGVPQGCTEAFHQFEFTESGTQYLASATTFKVDEGVEWVVGAIAPQSDFLADVWRARQFQMIVAAFALAVAVILAVWLADRVSGPVLAMMGFMRRVGDGQLDERANFGGSREFQELSAALNRMIDDLRDRLRLRYSLSVANDVQQRLLPAEPPTIAGLDVAGFSSYCDETGGDYYDFLPCHCGAGETPSTLTAVVGDVAGHGIGAALVMAGARALVRDRADCCSLGELLSRINRLLINDLGGEKFMTMLLCVIDTRTATLRWASAGHDAAIVFDPISQDFLNLGRGDLPLGVQEESEYIEQPARTLAPGTVIVMATDGVWEMHGLNGDMFGKERFRDIIRRNASKSAAEISKVIVETLQAFRGGKPAVDDVTLVVMKLTATTSLDNAPLGVTPTVAHGDSILLRP